jgi:hypothetical protein
LYHEACRHDRDKHIEIHKENIEHINFTPYYENQFEIEEKGNDFGAYDFDSIMHYSSYMYSKNNEPTITKLDGSKIYTNEKLSNGDIEAIRSLYEDVKRQPILSGPISFTTAPSRKQKVTIQPPSITIDPPPVRVTPPPITISPPSIVVSPPKIKVSPPPMRILGKNYNPPSFDVTPPSITVEPEDITVNPPDVVVDPPSITVTPPPIEIEV